MSYLASFGVTLNVVEWTAQFGFVSEGTFHGVELTLEEFIRKTPGLLQSLERSWMLAQTLQQMRADGSSIEDMDKVLRAIDADGGL
jgi:hypothetical protein